MQPSKKFYAVKRGRVNGVFEGWECCRPYVSGFKDALYRKFDTRKEAMNYLKIQQITAKEMAKWEVEQTLYYSRKPEITNAYVDGSFSEHVYGGAFIVIKDGLIAYERSKRGTNRGAARKMGSDAGELQAAMLAIQYALNNNSKQLLIYHDNERIRDLIRKKSAPNGTYEEQYVRFVTECQKKGSLSIDFIKVKAHNGGRNKWNDYVDKLAVEARKSNHEVDRDLEEIRHQLAVIGKQPNALSQKQKSRLYAIGKKVTSGVLLTAEEGKKLSELLSLNQADVSEVEQNKNIKESSSSAKRWKTTHSLYKSGMTFAEIVERRNTLVQTIIQHLAIAKVKYKDMKVDNYLPIEEKVLKKRDKRLADLVMSGLSWQELSETTGYNDHHLLSRIFSLYMAKKIPSVDEVYERKKTLRHAGEIIQQEALAEVTATTDVDEHSEQKDRFKRCLSFLKENRLFMRNDERDQANAMYVKIKSDKSVTMRQKEQLFDLAKTLKKRKDILSFTHIPSFAKTYHLVKMGLTAGQVAAIRGIQMQTVVDHLVSAYNNGGDIDLKRFLSHANVYHVILDKLKIHGASKMLLRHCLSESVSYEDIKIVAVLNGYPFQL